jgi:hypothetical protein
MVGGGEAQRARGGLLVDFEKSRSAKAKRPFAGGEVACSMGVCAVFVFGARWEYSGMR